MWYAVLRKPVRGIFIGTLCIRHTGRQTLLEEQGWEEVPVRDRRDRRRRRLASGDVDRRADRDLVVQLDHVGDRHADAAVRGGVPSE